MGNHSPRPHLRVRTAHRAAKLASFSCAAALILHTFAGCASSAPDFESTNPNARLAAAVQAADTRDRAAIPGLVELLASDDPRQRLIAINALERITGQTMGYDYAAPAYDRNEPLQRWEEFVHASASSTSPPAPPTPTSAGP